MRAVFKMSQYLIAALRVGVMIGVAFKVKQQDVAEHIVCVPTVMWLTAFAPFFDPLAFMLYALTTLNTTK